MAYPDNKELAAHLNVIPMAISNMVGKYLEGKPMGRKKMTEEEKAQAKLKRDKEKKLKAQKEAEKEQQQEIIPQQTVTNQESEVVIPQPINSNAISFVSESIQPRDNSFSIKLDKNMIGEEAVLRLNGVANSLLKEKEYKVELNIMEA